MWVGGLCRAKQLEMLLRLYFSICLLFGLVYMILYSDQCPVVKKPSYILCFQNVCLINFRASNIVTHKNHNIDASTENTKLVMNNQAETLLGKQASDFNV